MHEHGAADGAENNEHVEAMSEQQGDVKPEVQQQLEHDEPQSKRPRVDAQPPFPLSNMFMNGTTSQPPAGPSAPPADASDMLQLLKHFMPGFKPHDLLAQLAAQQQHQQSAEKKPGTNQHDIAPSDYCIDSRLLLLWNIQIGNRAFIDFCRHAD